MNNSELVEKLSNTIIECCEFKDEKDLKEFIKLLKDNLMELYDPDYVPDSTSSSEDDLEDEVIPESIKVKKTIEDFYEISD